MVGGGTFDPSDTFYSPHMHACKPTIQMHLSSTLPYLVSDKRRPSDSASRQVEHRREDRVVDLWISQRVPVSQGKGGRDGGTWVGRLPCEKVSRFGAREAPPAPAPPMPTTSQQQQLVHTLSHATLTHLANALIVRVKVHLLAACMGVVRGGIYWWVWTCSKCICLQHVWE
jgi:hypothetical protein